MAYSWIPISGYFLFDIPEGEICFYGGTTHPPDQEQIDELVPTEEEKAGSVTYVSPGHAVCDQRFAGGTLSADIEFNTVTDGTGCELIIYYSSASDTYVTAGIGGSPESMFTVRQLTNSGWYTLAQKGEKSNLEPDTKYHLDVTLKGSRLSITVNGVEVLITNLPFYLPPSQVGIWCQADSYITISNYTVQSERVKAFVIMQFTAPYNEVYVDVIKKICAECNVDVVRADEAYGPGVIISDIEKQINESKFVIADITPANPNVYYEVGYAHARDKPTILIAENPTKLPFDVSPFRTLFYENSIAGKNRVEEGLRNHIRAILNDLRLS